MTTYIGKITLSGSILTEKIQLSITADNGERVVFTGDLQTGDEQTLKSTGITLTVYPRGLKNTMKLPEKMTGFVV